MNDPALDIIRRSQLSILRLRFTFVAAERVSLPPFLGSTLRGAFGAALKSQVCVHPEPECAMRCLEPTCPFGEIFAPRRPTAKGGWAESPPAYVIRSLPAPSVHRLEIGDAVRFELLLFGPAVRKALTLRRSFFVAGQLGFGAQRAPFLLTRSEVRTRDEQWRFLPVHLTDETEASAEATPLADLVARKCAAFTGDDTLHIDLVTPLRIRVAGKFRRDLPFHTLLRAAANRVDELANAYGTPTACLNLATELGAATVRTEYERLAVNDWERFSNRQGAKMNLGGLTGTVVYRGSQTPAALALLMAGETLHVGSSTSFGLGLYRVSDR
jgi:hypothetical protein